MKILIVTRKYYPHGDATSEIVRNISEVFLDEGHDVSVVSITGYEDEQQRTEANGLKCYPIYVAESKNRDQIQELIKISTIKAFIIVLRKIKDKLAGKVIPAYRKLSLNPTLIRGYRTFFTKDYNPADYDMCIITMMPHEAIWVFRKKVNGGSYILDQLDTYWNNPVYPSIYTDVRKKFEIEVTQNSLFTLATPIIVRENTKQAPDLKQKLIEAEFPMVRINEDGKNIEHKGEGETIHCVFLGTLYPGIRPPEKVIRALSKVKDGRLVFDFYGSGQELIRELPDYQNAKSSIILHGSVSSQEARSIRDDADVLINIDNTSTLQVPSKVFEYICTGKPIINFFFNEDSPTLEYLSRYPNCLSINLNQIDNLDIQQLIDSITKEHLYTNVSVSEIRKTYEKCTPEYVARQFIEMYNKKNKMTRV